MILFVVNFELDYDRLEEYNYMYNIFDLVKPFLESADLFRLMQVCKLWHKVLSQPAFWKTVIITDQRYVCFRKMGRFLSEKETVRLKLVNCYDFSCTDDFAFLPALYVLDINNCTTSLVEMLPRTVLNLRVFRGSMMASAHSLDVSFAASMGCLAEFRLTGFNPVRDLTMLLINPGNLEHLSLGTTAELKLSRFFSIKPNYRLKSFGLGRFDTICDNFVIILSHYRNLKELHIEGGVKYPPELFEVISQLKHLTCLKLNEVGITLDFVDHLRQCTNIRHLTIIPRRHRFDMAFFNGIILKAVLQLRGSLKKFVWAFSRQAITYFKQMYCTDETIGISYKKEPPNCPEQRLELSDMTRILGDRMPGTVVIVTFEDCNKFLKFENNFWHRNF